MWFNVSLHIPKTLRIAATKLTPETQNPRTLCNRCRTFALAVRSFALPKQDAPLQITLNHGDMSRQTISSVDIECLKNYFFTDESLKRSSNWFKFEFEVTLLLKKNGYTKVLLQLNMIRVSAIRYLWSLLLVGFVRLSVVRCSLA